MAHNIVIIGAGPRGTYALRRLSLQLTRTPLDHPVVIHVVEKSGHFGGGGVHDVNQPDYLLLNTIASQITAVGDDDEIGRASMSRRTLYGFLEEKGIPVGENDYPARSHHGQYLASVFDWTENTLPHGVTLYRYPVTAVDIDLTDGQKVILDGAEAIEADEILLITGHSKLQVHPESKEAQWMQFAEECRHKRKNISYVHDVYPIPEKTAHIRGGESVYVIGMGLTAVDLVRAFSIGRGGTFQGGKYVKTGREPHIILGSRLGIPYCARAFNQKDSQYQPAIFTHEAISKLKSNSNKLDFQNDLFPLFWREVEYVYYSTMLGNDFGSSYLSCETDAERKELIKQSVREDIRLKWESLENPMVEMQRQQQGHSLFDSFESYMTFVINLIREDLREAEKGNMTSPLKCAIDSVFRDCRDVLRSAVNFGGLTAKSHKYLISVFDRVNNRIAVGPPVESTRQLLVLAESGYVMFSGPNPKLSVDEKQGCFVIESENVRDSRKYVQHVLNGRIHSVNIKNDTSPLMQNLLKKGILRTYINQQDDFQFEPGGLDVTEDFHVIAKDGNPHPHICAIGIPTEGKIWFNAVDARPDVNSTAISQVSRWAKGVVERLGRSTFIGNDQPIQPTRVPRR
jgi:uncharacterized NAD(P)/FAD-binding protein YdhS